jgi:hypothetical protein
VGCLDGKIGGGKKDEEEAIGGNRQEMNEFLRLLANGRDNIQI